MDYDYHIYTPQVTTVKWMSQILITCPGRRQHWPDKELQGSETFLALIFFRKISRVLDEEDARGHWAPRGAPTDWAFQVVLAPIYILPTTRMSAARALWPLLIITRQAETKTQKFESRNFSFDEPRKESLLVEDERIATIFKYLGGCWTGTGWVGG